VNPEALLSYASDASGDATLLGSDEV
jgi:hypothetical protein